MHPVIEKLTAAGVVLTDGAWGTQLQNRGLAIGDCPDAWNLTHSDQVEAVARAYVEAGSRVILTNTFGASRMRLDGFGLRDKVTEINRWGVDISRRAARGSAFVFASIGPSGKVLMMGNVTESELSTGYSEQAQAIAAAGADAIVVETMTDLAEAKIAVAAAKATNLPVVACMVFDSGKNKDRTMMGDTPERVAAELAAAGADVIGANCGQGIAGYIEVCKRLKAATTLPLWIKANAGLPEMVDGKPIYRTSAVDFARQAVLLKAAGATFIGGCCGTSPAFIAECKKLL